MEGRLQCYTWMDGRMDGMEWFSWVIGLLTAHQYIIINIIIIFYHLGRPAATAPTAQVVARQTA